MQMQMQWAGGALDTNAKYDEQIDGHSKADELDLRGRDLIFLARSMISLGISRARRRTDAELWGLARVATERRLAH